MAGFFIGCINLPPRANWRSVETPSALNKLTPNDLAPPLVDNQLDNTHLSGLSHEGLKTMVVKSLDRGLETMVVLAQP